MGLAENIGIAAEINNSAERDGHLISWKTLAWLLPLPKCGSDKPFGDYWQKHDSWLRACEEVGLDASQNISTRANRQTGEFWVSRELMAAVVAKDWEI
jgi:hypothetical protein